MNTCENNTCKDPQSYCLDVDNSYRCPCKPGFYSPTEAPEICMQGLTFGGILFLHNSVTDPNKTQILDFLNESYCNTSGYIRVNVGEHNSNTWNYELIYKVGSGVREFSIGHWFANYLSTTYSCEVTSTSCDIDLHNESFFTVDTEKSFENAGTADEVICTSSFEQYCDSESTSCNSVDGYATCNCLEGYVNIDEEERVCTRKICISNSDCNSPFGRCESDYNGGQGNCVCMFGFEGSHCYSPWLFVFVVAGGALLLMVVVLVSVVACHSSTKTVKQSSNKDISAAFSLSGLEKQWNGMKGLRAALPEDVSTNINGQDNEAYSDL